MLFKTVVNKNAPIGFTAHHHIRYRIPNTLESLGIELLINGIYEKKIVKFLTSQIKNGHTYFDIGANIGALGIPVIKNKSNVKYVGIEASPLVFEYLKFNFSENKIADYLLYNYLVHEDDHHAMKFYQSDYYGKSSLAPTYSDKYVLVNSISLDSFSLTHDIGKINWMKIDVQGFEIFVFKGMKKLIENRQVENILFEFEYWAEEDAGLESGSAQKYLLGLGYELFDLTGKKLPSVITTGRAMIWARPLP